jgi:hypothetical protein
MRILHTFNFIGYSTHSITMKFNFTSELLILKNFMIKEQKIIFDHNQSLSLSQVNFNYN